MERTVRLDTGPLPALTSAGHWGTLRAAGTMAAGATVVEATVGATAAVAAEAVVEGAETDRSPLTFSAL